MKNANGTEMTELEYLIAQTALALDTTRKTLVRDLRNLSDTLLREAARVEDGSLPNSHGICQDQARTIDVACGTLHVLGEQRRMLASLVPAQVVS